MFENIHYFVAIMKKGHEIQSFCCDLLIFDGPCCVVTVRVR